MIGIVVMGWVFLGFITICILAYNPYTDQFNWDLCEGDEAAGWVRYAMWGFVMMMMPRILTDTLLEKALDRLTLTIGIIKIRWQQKH